MVLGQATKAPGQGGQTQGQAGQTQGQGQGQQAQGQQAQPQQNQGAPMQYQQTLPYAGTPSLFPDNTLNVRVFVEKAHSPVNSPTSRRDLSARRPHSLRRSRSRDGLMSEYGASQNATQDAARAHIESTNAQDAAIAHIQRTRQSAGSVGSLGSRGPLRRSYAEKMREMEDKIRELDELEKETSVTPKNGYREKLASATPNKRYSYPSPRVFSSV